MTTIRLFFISATVLLLFSSSSTSAFCKEAERLDIVSLKNGAQLEGCITSEDGANTTMETIGGILVLPVKTILDVDKSSPGESAFVLGQLMLERRKYDRAEKFLKKAASVTVWKKAAGEQLRHLQELKAQEEKKRNDAERNQIEKLIERRGLQAGINALKRKQSKQNDEYWGVYRGKLHLHMAQDLLDHLDFRGAERQLKLAEQYGVDQDEWKKVRDKIVYLKKNKFLRKGSPLESQLALQRMKQKPQTYSSFLAAVQAAAKRGDKIPPLDYLKHVDRYSREYNIDPYLVWAMIDVESAWNPKAVSSKGAQGLMQIMPETAGDLNVTKPFDAEQNIRGGTAYLRFLMKMFDDKDKVLAAYHAGPGNVERKGIFKVSRKYISNINKRMANYKKKYGAVTSKSTVKTITVN